MRGGVDVGTVDGTVVDVAAAGAVDVGPEVVATDVEVDVLGTAAGSVVVVVVDVEVDVSPSTLSDVIVLESAGSAAPHPVKMSAARIKGPKRFTHL